MIIQGNVHGGYLPILSLYEDAHLSGLFESIKTLCLRMLEDSQQSSEGHSSLWYNKVFAAWLRLVEMWHATRGHPPAFKLALAAHSDGASVIFLELSLMSLDSCDGHHGHSTVNILHWGSWLTGVSG